MHTQIHTYIFWDLGIYMLRLRGRFHTSSVITHLCIYERIFQNLGEPWPPLTACGSTISCHGSVWQLEWYLGDWTISGWQWQVYGCCYLRVGRWWLGLHMRATPNGRGFRDISDWLSCLSKKLFNSWHVDAYA